MSFTQTDDLGTHRVAPAGSRVRRVSPSLAAMACDKRKYDWVTVVENIGDGAQGVVSKVTRTDNVRDVHALKHFAKPVFREHEESVLKEINRDGGHYHIVKPVDYTDCGIVFPFFPEGDLFDYVSRKGILSENEVARMMLKISSAVVYLHERNVAHMDIKLENILVDANKNPVLCDFGLSYRIPQHGLSRTKAGSLNYAAPELFPERRQVWFQCRAADVWSLGICAYTLCMGRFPAPRSVINAVCSKFEDGTILVFRRQRVRTAEFLAVLDQCLQIKPEKRAGADEVFRLWERFLARQPSSPDPTTPGPKEDCTFDPAQEDETAEIQDSSAATGCSGPA